MRADRTIPRAARRGTRSVPVEGRKAKYIRGDIRLDAEEVTIAVDMARTERIERDICAYAIRQQMAVASA